jgi:hypothetical protein
MRMPNSDKHYMAYCYNREELPLMLQYKATFGSIGICLVIVSSCVVREINVTHFTANTIPSLP